MPITKTADFRQGPKLEAQYPFNSAMHGGICFSLVVQWYKLLQEDDSTSSELLGTVFENPSQERMDALDEDFKLAGGRQMIYTSGLGASKLATDSWHAFGQSYAETLTGMGKHYGVAFDYVGYAQHAPALGNYLADPANRKKVLYLSIKMNVGGHAIGLQTSTPQLMFDPNIGEYEYTAGSAVQLATALWNFYPGIHHFLLYDMRSQQTMRELWEARIQAAQH
jgi:hypothetical protein